MEENRSPIFRPRAHTALLQLSDDLVQVGTAPGRAVSFSGITPSQISWLKRMFASNKRLQTPSGTDRQRIWQILRRRGLVQPEVVPTPLRLQCETLNRVSILLLRTLAAETSVSFDLRGGGRIDDTVIGLFDAEEAGMSTTGVLEEEFTRRGIAVTKHTRTDVAILCSTRVLNHGHAARFLSQEIPALPIVIDEDRITIGSLIIPGKTPCALCQEHYLLDVTPQWPKIRGQLQRLPPVVPSMSMSSVAAGLAACMLQSYWQGHLAGTTVDYQKGWEVSLTGVRSFTSLFHPRCTCKMSADDLQHFTAVKTRTYGSNTRQNS